ncbi:MAG TPA: hypothetical protein VJP81_01475 [Candidatus Dormibacteraeota bacterium]|nr:hypothetical protein [Candidatus Dormibacteraeota bacterium]
MAEPLDEFMPVYRHRERHQRTIAAQPVEVWRAMLALTDRELPLSRFLMGVRSIPRLVVRGDGRRNASSKPLIATFLKNGFRELRVDPPRLIIAGTAIQPWRLVSGKVADVHDGAGFRNFNQPGFVLAGISFELEPVNKGTLLATETRIQPTDTNSARAFLPYWLAIRAGSGLIRREMLSAVARMSERTP